MRANAACITIGQKRGLDLGFAEGNAVAVVDAFVSEFCFLGVGVASDTDSVGTGKLHGHETYTFCI